MASTFDMFLQNLPSINIHDDAPVGKQWTDQSLLSNEAIQTFLADSQAYQRICHGKIIAKRQQQELLNIDSLPANG